MMMDKANKPQSPSNNRDSSSVPHGDYTGDDGGCLPELAAYQGQGVLDHDDQSSVGLQKANPADPANKNNATSHSQPVMKGRIVLLLFTGLLITVAVVISIMGASGTFSSNKGKDDPARVESNRIVEATDSPTDVPSGMPSLAPSVSPQWTLEYVNLKADFSPISSNDIVIEYEMGINRNYQTQLLARDCRTPITPENLLRLTAVRSPNNYRSETLTLNYSVDNSLIKSSNVWNDGENQLNMCQVVQLVLPDVAFVIAEDRRNVDIGINLAGNFGGIAFDVELSPGEAAASTNIEDVPVEGGNANEESLPEEVGDP